MVQDDFNKTNTVPHVEKPEHSGNPVTKAELEMRISQRSTTVYESHLRPGGNLEKTVHEQVRMENEQRIKFIEKRMDDMRGIPKRDFDRSR